MTLAFMAKRAVGLAAQPLPVVFLFACVAAVLFLAGRRKRFAAFCAVLAGLTLLATTFPPLVRWQARWLEKRHAPLLPADAEKLSPRCVVVLGNGVAHPDDRFMPALTRLNDCARARLAEGVRLARLFPLAEVVVSGYGMGLENCADVMAEAAVELGVAPERVRVLPQSLDTAHEAELVKEIVGDEQVVLVTTAVHMPRAMAWFAEKGVDAAAAPCDFISPISEESVGAVDWSRWRPRGGSLADSEELWHEWLGLAYLGLAKAFGK